MSSPRPSDLPHLSRLADLMILHQGDADLVKVLRYTMKITAANDGYYKELITLRHDKCLQLLLNKFGNDNSLNVPYDLALYAIQMDSLNCLSVILAYAKHKSIDMNSSIPNNGPYYLGAFKHSLLYYAAQYKNSPCMNVLLQYGITDNPKPYTSAAQEACRINSPECLKLLITGGHDVLSKNSNGEDCLTIAAKNGGHECLKLLLNVLSPTTQTSDSLVSPLSKKVKRHLPDCSVCMEKAVEVMFIPCSHVTTCSGCSEKVVSCPICRGHIAKKMKAIFS